MNGVDPDGGLFGWLRAWTKKLFNGGRIWKDDNDKWYWQKGIRGKEGDLFGKGDFDEVMVEHKNYGYGGLGKFKYELDHLSGDGNLSFGLINYSNNVKAFSSVKLKLLTVDLLKVNSQLDQYGNVNTELDYIGKDGGFKGDVFSAQYESLKGDYGIKLKYKLDGKSKEFVTSTEYLEGRVGAPFLEAKILKVSKKGMNVHFGFQEDIGKSMGVYGSPFLSFAGKISFKTQVRIN